MSINREILRLGGSHVMEYCVAIKNTKMIIIVRAPMYRIRCFNTSECLHVSTHLVLTTLEQVVFLLDLFHRWRNW